MRSLELEAAEAGATVMPFTFSLPSLISTRSPPTATTRLIKQVPFHGTSWVPKRDDRTSLFG